MRPALALRFARRELRGGLKGFRVFLGCLTLGVAAIAGVGSLSTAILEGIRDNGRVILGGDVDLRLSHRPASETERAWLDAGATIAEALEMRSMARAADTKERALVELKAVDGRYPAGRLLRQRQRRRNAVHLCLGFWRWQHGQQRCAVLHLHIRGAVRGR